MTCSESLKLGLSVRNSQKTVRVFAIRLMSGNPNDGLMVLTLLIWRIISRIASSKAGLLRLKLACKMINSSLDFGKACKLFLDVTV